MSRTYRNPTKSWWSSSTSKKKFIDDMMERWYRRPYKTVFVYKTKAEYERDVEHRKKQYEESLARNGGSNLKKVYSSLFDWTYTVEIRYIPPSRKKVKTEPWSYEEALQEAHDRWEKIHRDGSCSDSGRKKGFKQEAARNNRRRNKEFCRRVLSGEDYDDMAHPKYSDTNWIAWNYW